MADLSPLKAVYQFFETGQTATSVVRRRYVAGGTTTGVSGLKARGAYLEVPIDVFEVPQRGRGGRFGDERQLEDRGAISIATRTLYATASFFPTDANIDQPADVIITADGRVWTVIQVNDWNEAEGYEVVIEWSGRRRGEAPFDA